MADRRPDKAAFLRCWIKGRLGREAMQEAEAAWQWRVENDNSAVGRMGLLPGQGAEGSEKAEG